MNGKFNKGRNSNRSSPQKQRKDRLFTENLAFKLV